ncbi:MAG: GNAT family N-acetyltransferase, partial [Candidatus Omnitrophica bacterium]|nr:GNAT family N-acetyltransferase [Candidatus Omnitrophota bacterium]
PMSGSLFVFDRFRAYYLIGGTDPDFRQYGVGTRNFHDVFVRLNSELGIKEVDFVGVNSPGRGGYKLSFGARIVPYFFIQKRPAQK